MAAVVVTVLVLLGVVVVTLYVVNKRNPSILQNLKSRYSTRYSTFKNENLIKKASSLSVKNPVFDETVSFYLFQINY